MDDADLYDEVYGDLEDFDKGEKLKEEQQKVNNLLERLNAAVAKNVRLREENKRIDAQAKVLTVNNGSLLLTARNELQRKDAEILALRRENHDICFRRGKSAANRAAPFAVTKPAVDSQSIAVQTDLTFGSRDTVDVCRRGPTNLALWWSHADPDDSSSHHRTIEASAPSAPHVVVQPRFDQREVHRPEPTSNRFAVTFSNRDDASGAGSAGEARHDSRNVFARQARRRQSMHEDRFERTRSERHGQEFSSTRATDSDGDNRRDRHKRKHADHEPRSSNPFGSRDGSNKRAHRDEHQHADEEKRRRRHPTTDDEKVERRSREIDGKSARSSRSSTLRHRRKASASPEKATVFRKQTTAENTSSVARVDRSEKTADDKSDKETRVSRTESKSGDRSSRLLLKPAKLIVEKVSDHKDEQQVDKSNDKSHKPLEKETSCKQSETSSGVNSRLATKASVLPADKVNSSEKSLKITASETSEKPFDDKPACDTSENATDTSKSVASPDAVPVLNSSTAAVQHVETPIDLSDKTEENAPNACKSVSSNPVCPSNEPIPESPESPVDLSMTSDKSPDSTSALNHQHDTRHSALLKTALDAVQQLTPSDSGASTPASATTFRHPARPQPATFNVRMLDDIPITAASKHIRMPTPLSESGGGAPFMSPAADGYSTASSTPMQIVEESRSPSPPPLPDDDEPPPECRPPTPPPPPMPKLLPKIEPLSPLPPKRRRPKTPSVDLSELAAEAPHRTPDRPPAPLTPEIDQTLAMDIDDDLTAACQHNAQRQSADIIDLFDALETPRKTPIGLPFATIPDRGSLITGSAAPVAVRGRQTIVEANYVVRTAANCSLSTAKTPVKLPVPVPIAPKSAKKFVSVALGGRRSQTPVADPVKENAADGAAASPDMFEQTIQATDDSPEVPTPVTALVAPPLDQSAAELYVTLSQTPLHNTTGDNSVPATSMMSPSGPIGEDELLEREMRLGDTTEQRAVETPPASAALPQSPAGAIGEDELLERELRVGDAEVRQDDAVVEQQSEEKTLPETIQHFTPAKPILTTSITVQSAISPTMPLLNSSAERRVHETSFMSCYVVEPTTTANASGGADVTGPNDSGELHMVVTRKRRRRPKAKA